MGRVNDEPVTSGPWTRRSRRVAYENPWITVFHDEVTRPDGASGVYGVVHPAASACGIVVLDEHDRTLLVGQHRYTLDEYSWEIPEGGVDAADPLAGAQRELREETGVAAAQWHELGRFTLSNSVSDERGVMYLATGITFGTAEPEGTEVLEVRWVPFADALGMVLDGRITDAISIMGIQRVALARLAAASAGGQQP